MLQAFSGCSRAKQSKTHFDSMSNLLLSEQVFTTDAPILAISILPMSASLFLLERVSLMTLRSTLKPGLPAAPEESPTDSPLNDYYQYIHSDTKTMLYLPFTPKLGPSKQLFKQTTPHLYREVGLGDVDIFIEDITMVLHYFQAK